MHFQRPCSFSQQKIHHIHPPAPRCVQQHWPAKLVYCIHISASVNERSRHIYVPAGSGEDECCVTVYIYSVDMCTCCNQLLRDVCAGVFGGKHEGSVAKNIMRISIGTALQ